MKFHLPIHISGIASTLPKGGRPIADKRVTESTGILAVRIAEPGTRASDLCFTAAEHLLQTLNLDRQSIDAIVFISQTPDRIMPATSVTLQNRLSLSKNVAAFDIAYGCSGYIYGLLQAGLLVAAGARKVLLCASDVISPLLHPKDRATASLFGDAGSATIVEKSSSLATIVVHSDGLGAETLYVPRADEGSDRPGFLHMDGGEVMAFALRSVPDVIDETLAGQGWSRESIGLYGLHQANEFILRFLRRKLGVPTEFIPNASHDTGNTGPSSIPLLLSRVGPTIQRERLERTILCGFGVGLSWGAVAVNMQSTCFLPPIEL